MLRVYGSLKQTAVSGHRLRHDTHTSMRNIALLTSLAAVAVGLTYFLLPYFLRFIAQNVGSTIRARTQTRRELLLKRATDDEKATPSTSDKDRLAKVTYHGKSAHEWDGIIGFFHPFW
jgi:alpha-1,2-mannosyltransferase